jgi:hypothetical protein
MAARETLRSKTRERLDDDSGLAASQCSSCTHFFEGSYKRPACEAFPQGIPDEVFDNYVDHRKPYRADLGLRWQADTAEKQHPGIRPRPPV